MGGWTKTKLMLFSTQVEVVVELKLELSLAKMLLSLTILGKTKSYIICPLERIEDALTTCQ